MVCRFSTFAFAFVCDGACGVNSTLAWYGAAEFYFFSHHHFNTCGTLSFFGGFSEFWTFSSRGILYILIVTVQQRSEDMGDHVDFYSFGYLCFDTSCRTHCFCCDKCISAFVTSAFIAVHSFLSFGNGITPIGFWKSF